MTNPPVAQLGPTRAYPWRVFVALLISGTLGAAAVIPYGLASSAAALRNVPIPLAIVALLQFLQGVIFVGVAAGLGLLISGRLGLGAPLLQAWLYKDRTYDARWRFGSSAGIGVVVGAVVALLAHFVFLPRIPQLLATDIDIAQ